MNATRTLRQRLVPEIGDEGQARLATMTGVVSERGLAGEIAARYLACAGLRELRVAEEGAFARARAAACDLAIEIDPVLLEKGASSTSTLAAPADLDPIDPAPAALLAGALSALRVLKGAVR
jgi:hypothetical protein